MTASPGHNKELAERAYRIRRNAVLMGEVQGQGYIAQALDIADVLAVAYFHAMRYRPDDPDWEGRDRFLLSNGHYAIALYAALIEAGIIPVRSSRPMAATRAACPCPAWPPTRRGWRCRAARSALASPSPWARRWG